MPAENEAQKRRKSRVDAKQAKEAAMKREGLVERYQQINDEIRSNLSKYRNEELENKRSEIKRELDNLTKSPYEKLNEEIKSDEEKLSKEARHMSPENYDQEFKKIQDKKLHLSSLEPDEIKVAKKQEKSEKAFRVKQRFEEKLKERYDKFEDSVKKFRDCDIGTTSPNKYVSVLKEIVNTSEEVSNVIYQMGDRNHPNFQKYKKLAQDAQKIISEIKKEIQNHDRTQQVYKDDQEMMAKFDKKITSIEKSCWACMPWKQREITNLKEKKEIHQTKLAGSEGDFKNSQAILNSNLSEKRNELLKKINNAKQAARQINERSSHSDNKQPSLTER